MEKEKILYSDNGKQTSPPRRAGRLDREAARAEYQIEIECFGARDKPRAKEICLIMAEIALLPEWVDVQIAGEKLPAELVKEVYTHLTHEHVENVLRSFERANYTIVAKKTWIRTALYNSVFEFEHQIENTCRAEFTDAEEKP